MSLPNPPVCIVTLRSITPEHVRLNYALADLGARAAALAIDLGAMAAGGLLLGLGLRYGALLDDLLAAVGTTLLIFAFFLIQWGYFILFEGIWGGRTPGKRAIGIRVIHAGGEPLSFRGAVLRNLIRVVDLQPAASGLVGAAAILANRRAQRLGDLVAGTIVVHDSGSGEHLSARSDPVEGRATRPVLSAEQFDLLAGYMARRKTLAAGVRPGVAASLAAALAFALRQDGETDNSDADRRLVQLYEEEAPRHAARSGGATLQAATMAREQRESWARYADLVERGNRRGLDSLSEEEVRSFGALYRALTADLARARTYGASPGLLGTIQRWAGSGHNLLYRSRGRAAVSLGHWVRCEFPRSVRRYWRHLLLASVLFYGSGALTYEAVRDDPLLGRALAGQGVLARAELIERNNPNAPYLAEWDDFTATDMPILGSQVMTNNIGVTFMAFAGGLVAGYGTLLVILLNGITLGGVLGAFANEGVLGVILAFVFSHGFIELTAICIAGAAGFGLGSALLLPGRRTRGEALRERARTFLSLIAGTTLMLAAAGIIEGFVSPSSLPAVAKFVLGSLTAILLVLYFGFAGREEARSAQRLGTNDSSPGAVRRLL